jgi:hypothetical protein
MKRIVLLTLLALALPFAAFANTSSVDFTNSGGMLTGTNAGLSLTGSELIAVNGLNGGGLVLGSLGGVTFTTGSLISGSLQTGGMFNGGGSFIITSNGSQGLPNGVLFTGSFTGPVTWTETVTNGVYNYTLTGTISGKLYNGVTISGATTQITIATRKGPFNGSTMIASGDTSMASTVPEPGTLGLLGTGLIGLAAGLHRKMKS